MARRQATPETREFEGTMIRLTRRRYPGRTFCWLAVCIDGTWMDCGDPWPQRTPRAEDIRDAISYERSRLNLVAEGEILPELV